MGRNSGRTVKKEYYHNVLAFYVAVVLHGSTWCSTFKVTILEILVNWFLLEMASLLAK